MFSTKTLTAVAAAAAFSAAGLTGAEAAQRHYGYGPGYNHSAIMLVHQRIRNQVRRIRRGRFSGRLTWVEARKLRFELSHIRGFKARYLGDGYLSRFEQRHLHGLLNQNSRRIRRMATNGSGGWGNWHRDRRRSRLSRLNGFK